VGAASLAEMAPRRYANAETVSVMGVSPELVWKAAKRGAGQVKRGLRQVGGVTS
jgi:hypothetical protein